MKALNIEIKAKTDQEAEIEKKLHQLNADYKGTDHQTDTYFKVNSGRLKLREGNIENTLIWYDRKEVKGLKESHVSLMHLNKTDIIFNILKQSNGILKVIKKYRKIFFIDNVKFHIDEVAGLGKFIEIEAINTNNESKETLTKQCNYYLELFNIKKEQLIDKSYSDMLLK